jgi:hypothetical protein
MSQRAMTPSVSTIKNVKKVIKYIDSVLKSLLIFFIDFPIFLLRINEPNFVFLRKKSIIPKKGVYYEKH